MTNETNDHDPDTPKKKIVRFPSLAERDRIRKQQNKQEKLERNTGKEPFFNFGAIPPFIKYSVLVLFLIHAALALGVSPQTRVMIIETYGLIPLKFTGAPLTLTTLLSPVTYSFLHVSWVHLTFNAIMLLAMGTFVERMYGAMTTLKLSLLCGIGGAVAFCLMHPFSTATVIGASGAISGLFAASIMIMYEQGRLGALTGRLANKGPWPLILIWAAILVLIGLIGGGIAWEAHLGGFLTGATLFHFMRKGKLKL